MSSRENFLKVKDELARHSRKMSKSVELAGKYTNTQIYADMVTRLKGIKTFPAKAAKWANVFVGPLFDLMQ